MKGRSRLQSSPCARPRAVFFLAALVILPHLRALPAEGSRAGVFPPVDPDSQLLWQRLDALREKGDWQGLLEGLSEHTSLLARPEENSVVPSGGGLSLGLRRLLGTLVARLPPAFREPYRERLDAAIEELWAGAADDVETRRRLRHAILRDHPLASLSAEALEEEAAEAFERGDWERAEAAGRRLVSLASKEGRRADEAWAILYLLDVEAGAGATRAASGEVPSLRARLSELRDELREGEALRGFPRELRERLDAALARPAAPRPPAPWPPAPQDGQQGPVSSALRLEVHAVELPEPASGFSLGNVVWRESVSSSRLRRFMEEQASAALSGEAALPYHAASDEEIIVFQHVDRLSTFDRATHRRRWSLPVSERSGSFIELRAPLLGSARCFYVAGETLHAVRARDGAPLWRLEVAYDVEGRRPRLRDPGDIDGAVSAGARERAEEGERVEDGGGAGAPREKGGAPTPGAAHSALTPPVFSGETLVVGITTRVSRESLSYLTCLDVHGEELWTTFVGSVEEGDYLGLGGCSSPPLAAGGVIYALSNQGLLAAVDGRDGVLLWVNEYRRLDPLGRREAARTANRWQPNPLLIHGDLLVAAPQDSAYLLAFNRVSGEESWRSPREECSTLLGADQRACFIAGRRVAAVGHSGNERGRVLWSFAPQDTGFLPLGRSALADGRILLSGRRSLLCLSPRDGRVVSRTLWDFTSGGGNLLLSGGFLAVTSPEAIFVYDFTDGGAGNGASAATAPAEATALERLRRARSFLKNVEIEAGLEFLRAWAQDIPLAPAPNSELDHLQLDLAEITRYLSRFEEGAARARELLEMRLRLERTPERRVEAAIELAEKALEEKRPNEALKTLHEALREDSQRTRYSPDGVLRVSSEAYLRDRILSLRQANPELLFEEVEQRAEAALAEARKKSTPPSYLEVLRIYPYTQAAAHAYLDLFTSYQDRQSLEPALRALEGYLQDFEPLAVVGLNEIARVKLLLASLLHENGRPLEAKRYYLALLADHGDSVVEGVRGAKRRETVREYVEPRLSDPRMRAADVEAPPRLRFPVRMAWRSPSSLRDRLFLQPRGKAPAALLGHFLTQGVEVIEARSIETGLVKWTAELELVPGFRLEEPLFRVGRRVGRRALQGVFAGSLIVLYDEENLFAVDAERGTVRWHVPFGGEAPDAAGIQLPSLRERIRGVAFSEAAVFAASTRNTLYRFSLEGERLWEQKLGYDPASRPAYSVGDKVFVHAQKPTQGLHVHDASTGEELRFLSDEHGIDARLAADPVLLEGHRLLLPSDAGLKLFDLSREELVWSYDPPGMAQIKQVEHFDDAPGECILVFSRKNDWPAVVALSLADGKETWRYEDFDARQTTFSIFREGRRLYIVHGEDQWKLLALEIRPGTEVDRPMAIPVWPEEVPLGLFYSPSQRRLHLTADSVLFSVYTSNSLWVYNKEQGESRVDLAAEVGRFLAHKGYFDSAVLGDKLVLLTSSGDCAFESTQRPASERARLQGLDANSDPHLDMERVRRFLANPGDFEAASRLALDYFRHGDSNAAIRLLSRSLRSENVLIENDAEQRARLKYLLDGIKEEHMEREVPAISAHRLSQPPLIDGDLADPWDITNRVHLNDPVHVGSILVPGKPGDWDGVEDLGAILYTGWDDTNFYFALDVSDDSLHPYDRDAEDWRGGCLIIGVDPDNSRGRRQSGDDQLMTLALTIPKRKLDKDKDKDDPGEGKEGEDGGDDDDEAGSKPDGLFSVRKKEDDSGAIYEVALPWKAYFGSIPQPGTTFGLSLLLTDDDSGRGATKTLSLNPCHLVPRGQKSPLVWKFIIPEFFPKVRLE
jgi:outer membrane protein assembly factor BamB/tetratricopeptide (TPR) repeat protein